MPSAPQDGLLRAPTNGVVDSLSPVSQVTSLRTEAPCSATFTWGMYRWMFGQCRQLRMAESTLCVVDEVGTHDGLAYRERRIWPVPASCGAARATMCHRFGRTGSAVPRPSRSCTASSQGGPKNRGVLCIHPLRLRRRRHSDVKIRTPNAGTVPERDKRLCAHASGGIQTGTPSRCFSHSLFRGTEPA